MTQVEEVLMVEEKDSSRKTLQNFCVEKISLPLFLDERIDGSGVFSIFDLNICELHFQTIWDNFDEFLSSN